jgi:hypothetical protein
MKRHRAEDCHARILRRAAWEREGEEREKEPVGVQWQKRPVTWSAPAPPKRALSCDELNVITTASHVAADPAWLPGPTTAAQPPGTLTS